ncbi:MAG: NUDIX domain-containing protein [Candidatus Hermodarchaeota archaeon]
MVKQEGRFQIGIGAIIENTESEKILLLHRSHNMEFSSKKWDDVGGRMKQYENPEKTLQREVNEETGIINFEIVKPIDVSHYFRGERKAENEMIVINYWCRTSESEVFLSEEHDEFRWVYPTEALELTEDPQIKRVINRFIQEKSLSLKK